MTQAKNLSALGSNVDSSGVLSAASGGTGLSSPGSSGNVLTSNGTAWTSAAAASSIPSGSRVLFYQAAAPTGWTQYTSLNNYALRIVSGTGAGTGGSVGFTTAFTSQAVTGTVGTSGATTLTTSQIPNHYHSVYISGFAGVLGFQVYSGGPDGSQYAFQDYPDVPQYSPLGTPTAVYANNDNGGGGSHTHSGGTFTGTAINLAVQYADVIICTKD